MVVQERRSSRDPLLRRPVHLSVPCVSPLPFPMPTHRGFLRSLTSRRAPLPLDNRRGSRFGINLLTKKKRRKKETKERERKHNLERIRSFSNEIQSSLFPSRKRRKRGARYEDEARRKVLHRNVYSIESQVKSENVLKASLVLLSSARKMRACKGNQAATFSKASSQVFCSFEKDDRMYRKYLHLKFQFIYAKILFNMIVFWYFRQQICILIFSQIIASNVSYLF